MRNKLIALGTLGVLALAFMFSSSLYPALVKAASSTFNTTTCYTNAATSSPAYQSSGLATSTVTCTLGLAGADKAVVAVEVNASSTASTWNFLAEESMNGQDWFPVGPSQDASTTPFLTSVQSPATYIFASSTIGGTANTASLNGIGVNGSNNRNHFVFNVPVRMRMIRVYAAMTAGAGAVWMNILPKSTL